MLIMSDVTRGFTDTMILVQLKKSDSYGYLINKNINLLTNNKFELKEATLYSAFRRLEASKYIVSYWGDSDVGARRRYYSITTKGEKLLLENKKDWNEIKLMIDLLLGDDNYE